MFTREPAPRRGSDTSAGRTPSRTGAGGSSYDPAVRGCPLLGAGGRCPSNCRDPLDAISLPGKSVFRFMARKDEMRYFPPKEIADGIGHPKGTAGVAGLLGGVGKAIRRAGLPVYTTSKGTSWHYIWGWDGERYSRPLRWPASCGRPPDPELFRLHRRGRS